MQQASLETSQIWAGGTRRQLLFTNRGSYSSITSHWTVKKGQSAPQAFLFYGYTFLTLWFSSLEEMGFFRFCGEAAAQLRTRREVGRGPFLGMWLFVCFPSLPRPFHLGMLHFFALYLGLLLARSHWLNVRVIGRTSVTLLTSPRHSRSPQWC